MKRAVAYCRVSKDEQAEGLSLDVQEASLRDYAQQKGWGVVAALREHHTSTTLDRPELNRVFDMARRGQFDVLLIAKQDRLGRDSKQYYWAVYELEKAGVQVVDISRPSLPPAFEAAFVGFQAGADSEDNRKRAEASWDSLDRAARVEGRLPSGGWRLYGFDYQHRTRGEDGKKVGGQRTVNPTEAMIVKRMVKWITDGASLHEVCRQLNSEGITTRAGRPWRPIVVKRVLKNPAICGKPQAYRWAKDKLKGDRKRIIPKREVVDLPGEHPEIISPDEWELVQQRLGERPHYPRKYEYLLSGMIFCGLCGKAMNGNPLTARGRPVRLYYRCRGDNLRYKDTSPNSHKDYFVNADRIERLAWEPLWRALATPHALEKMLAEGEDTEREYKARLQELDKALAAWKLKENTLIRRASQFDFDPRLVEEELGRIRTAQETVGGEREEVQAKLAAISKLKEQGEALKSYSSLIPFLKNSLENATVGQKRQILKELRFRLYVLPAPRNHIGLDRVEVDFAGLPRALGPEHLPSRLLEPLQKDW